MLLAAQLRTLADAAVIAAVIVFLGGSGLIDADSFGTANSPLAWCYNHVPGFALVAALGKVVCLFVPRPDESG